MTDWLRVCVMGCHVTQRDIPVWQHCKKAVIGTAATSRNCLNMARDVESNVKSKQRSTVFDLITAPALIPPPPLP